tara:strand:+ start:1077 stop:1724 length:648 start_codon:yes stop_codon:yes gene_type:complete
MKNLNEFLNESELDVSALEKDLKNYTQMDGEWKSEKKLDDIFKDIDINKMKKQYPDIFEINSSLNKPSVYAFRGTTKDIKELKALGNPDELYTDANLGTLLLWNKQKIKNHSEIQSVTIYPNVAKGFAENSSSYNLPEFGGGYDFKSPIPTIYFIPVKENKKQLFMNYQYMTELSGIEEGEFFHSGKQFKSVDVAIIFDESLYEHFDKEEIEKLK